MKPKTTLCATLVLVLGLAATSFAWPALDETAAPAVADPTTMRPDVPVLVAVYDHRLEAIVAAIDAWQIEKRGEVPVTLERPTSATALDAAIALGASHGGGLDLVETLALRQLSPDIDAALRDVLVDFLVYEQETLRTFADVDVEAVRASPSVDAVPLAGVIAAQEALFGSLRALERALALTADRPLVPIVTDSFIVRLGGCEDNVYTQDLPLLIDECGADVYRNNAGGGSIIALTERVTVPAAALADFDGNDQYLAPYEEAVAGGGFVGAGFLYDAAGDDKYLNGAANDGINGGGSIGSGFLVDDGGNDVFAAGGWGTNGGGYIGGRGLLIDSAGADAYSGTHEAVNGGGGLGVGGLWDDAGDDSYTATFLGVNGGAVGGAGFVYDRLGRDVYDDEQGGSGIDMTVVPKETSGAQVDDA